MKKLIIPALAISLFTGCASMQETWVNKNCNKDAGYSQGMNDARNQVGMDLSKYNQMCKNAGEVTAAYREGYSEELKSLHVDDSFNHLLQPNVKSVKEHKKH